MGFLNKALAAAGITAAVSLGVLGGMAWSDDTPPPNQPAAATSTPSSTSSAATAVADNEACNGFTVKLDQHEGADVITGGLKGDTPEAKKQFVADFVQHEPTAFQQFFNASPLVQNHVMPAITDPSALVDKMENGSCWNQKGKDAYNQWKYYWDKVDAKAVPLPAHGTNTGANASGVFNVAAGPIATGTATQFTYKDDNGQEIGDTTARDQCGNVVGQAPVAGVPTGELPPAEYVVPPPDTTVVPTCTPGVDVECTPPTIVPTCTPGVDVECTPITTTPPQVCPPDKPHGHWPVCKDDPSKGVDNNPDLPTGTGYSPRPTTSSMAEPDHPDVPKPSTTALPTATMPSATSVPTDQGGPTSTTTRTSVAQTTETEAPATSAPQATCIPGPGQSSC